MSGARARLGSHFGRDVMVVETAYPWTLRAHDATHNVGGEGSPWENRARFDSSGAALPALRASAH